MVPPQMLATTIETPTRNSFTCNDIMRVNNRFVREGSNRHEAIF